MRGWARLRVRPSERRRESREGLASRLRVFVRLRLARDRWFFRRVLQAMRWIWIDKFLEFRSGQFARAIKNLTLAEEHLHDHFPGYPVMPASLIIEGLAQTGGILVGEAGGFRRESCPGQDSPRGVLRSGVRGRPAHLRGHADGFAK